ncbi:MAG TPA: c-type cytochrome [Bacteroidia bacterium]|nr:c-type cytochrome [Bacteroidia bacterium]
MKKLFIILSIAALLYACSGGGDNQNTSGSDSQTGDLFKEGKPDAEDEAKGIGKFTDVEISPTLDVKMAETGKGIYDLKCNACHKLTKEKLVGPGWSGVTTRRKVEWILNFTTNPDEMLNKDPAAQALLEECLVRMPNQGLSDDDARHVYEFMRQNDGVK